MDNLRDILQVAALIILPMLLATSIPVLLRAQRWSRLLDLMVIYGTATVAYATAWAISYEVTAAEAYEMTSDRQHSIAGAAAASIAGALTYWYV